MALCCDFMSTVLLYIPGSSDPPSTLQESPTRFPPTRPKSKAKDPPKTEGDIKNETGMKTKQKYYVSALTHIITIFTVNYVSL